MAPTLSSPLFHIGRVPVHGDAILAPMDGFSDWPFRSLCRGLGSAMSYTEFIKSEYLVQAFARMEPRMRFDESERPASSWFQGLAGDADWPDAGWKQRQIRSISPRRSLISTNFIKSPTAYVTQTQLYLLYLIIESVKIRFGA
jgi:hypothetical protein